MTHRISRLLVILLLCASASASAEEFSSFPFPFKDGDRIAWVGSSSTCIGQYCQTIEFLLRTRFPEMKITCRRFSNINKDTFAKCLVTLPGWLNEFKPTLVFFQYGGNDSEAGEAGLGEFKTNCEKCMALARDAHAKVFLITPQSVDEKMYGAENTKKFYRYAEKLIEFSKENKWPLLDTHDKLVELLELGQKDDPKYTVTHDKTHMMPAAYTAWGYYQWAMLNPPPAESLAALSADGKIISATRCVVSDVKVTEQGLSFTRADEILPILPPGPWPPRTHVPLEAYSRYMLKVSGLPAGTYQIVCEKITLGTADSKALAEGVNLNSLLLDASKQTPAPAPWDKLAKELWDAGKKPLATKGSTGGDAVIQEIGKTKWNFELSLK